MGKASRLGLSRWLRGLLKSSFVLFEAGPERGGGSWRPSVGCGVWDGGSMPN